MLRTTTEASALVERHRVDHQLARVKRDLWNVVSLRPLQALVDTERLHVSMLYWALLERWARLRAEWVTWAAAEVSKWPDEHGPRDRESVRALLERALAAPDEFSS